MEEKFYWFVFHKQQLLIKRTGELFSIPCSNKMPVPVKQGYLVQDAGMINGITCKTYPAEEDFVNYSNSSDLRASYNILDEVFYNMAGRCYELVHWDIHSRFCPVCSTETVRFSKIGKKCPKCGNEIFPSISPAIIVLIQKGDSVLMVHARNFRGTFRGLIAGFAEPGESLEQCVEREVMEETGLKIKNLKYFSSQPWPYPSVIMIGFTAEYESGEISLQDEELDFGRFFTIDNLPELPKKLSLARKLLDWWIEKQNKSKSIKSGQQ